MRQSKKTKAVGATKEGRIPELPAASLQHQETQTLQAAIGERLRHLREANRKRQEDIAAAARTWGLEWERATVAALELGRRQLSLEEFLLLPGILLKAGLQVLDNDGKGWGFPQLADVLPTDTFADLTPITTVSPAELRKILNSQVRLALFDLPYRLKKHDAIIRLNPVVFHLTAPGVKLLNIESSLLRYFQQHGKNREVTLAINATADKHGDAELKAAHKLDVPSYVVALSALLKWGHSLTEERDRLLAEQVTPDTTPRTVQALRGHITRALLSELQPHIAELMRIGNRELSRRKEE